MHRPYLQSGVWKWKFSQFSHLSDLGSVRRPGAPVAEFRFRQRRRPASSKQPRRSSPCPPRCPGNAGTVPAVECVCTRGDRRQSAIPARRARLQPPALPSSIYRAQASLASPRAAVVCRSLLLLRFESLQFVVVFKLSFAPEEFEPPTRKFVVQSVELSSGQHESDYCRPDMALAVTSIETGGRDST